MRNSDKKNADFMSKHPIFATQMLRVLISMFIVVFLSSCEGEIPDEIIQPDRMTEVMVDFHLAEAICIDENLSAQATNQKMFDYRIAICKKHKIDTALFSKSWKFYCSNPKLYEKVQDEVVERLNIQQMKNNK
jgi:hypothetical protein